MTHTYATLAVSRVAFDEIYEKLRKAGYAHALHDAVIDMHGIGLVRVRERRVRVGERKNKP